MPRARRREDPSFDGYVFATHEYNHGSSGALENAIDFLYYE
jgi:NAD(P)H-dependent FMN reductase